MTGEWSDLVAVWFEVWCEAGLVVRLMEAVVVARPILIVGLSG